MRLVAHLRWRVDLDHCFGLILLAMPLPLMSSNYNVIMLLAPFFMLVALWLMWGVRRGEAKVMEAVYAR